MALSCVVLGRYWAHPWGMTPCLLDGGGRRRTCQSQSAQEFGWLWTDRAEEGCQSGTSGGTGGTEWRVSGVPCGLRLGAGELDGASPVGEVEVEVGAGVEDVVEWVRVARCVPHLRTE